MHPRCEFCGRKLTNPESQARGYGDECAAKLSAQLSAVTAAVSAVEGGYKGDARLVELVGRLRRIEERIAGGDERPSWRAFAADVRREIAARAARLPAGDGALVCLNGEAFRVAPTYDRMRPLRLTAADGTEYEGWRESADTVAVKPRAARRGVFARMSLASGEQIYTAA